MTFRLSAFPQENHRRYRNPANGNFWKHLNIVATVSTAPGHSGTMTAGEHDHCYQMLNALPGHIAEFSKGLGGLTVTTIETTMPITQVSADGFGGVWVPPGDATAFYTAYGSNYDTACLWTSGSVLVCGASGLTTSGPPPAGHSYIPVGDAIEMGQHQTLPVHEWCWHALAYWITKGFPQVPGQNAGAYTDPRTGAPYNGNNNYHEFYHDQLQGKVPDGSGGYLGGSPAAWASGRPKT